MININRFFRVCKRKFADVEALKQHEQLSALHKENVNKKRKLEEKSVEYRDRASERRTMHDNDAHVVNVAPIDPTIVNMGPSLEKARTVTTTEKVTPDQSLGNSNVGNQLLQKLGWKSGGSLGRSRVDESTGAVQQSSVVLEDKLLKLKQDWEKIEHLSENSGKR